jgi:hypothetical protein
MILGFFLVHPVPMPKSTRPESTGSLDTLNGEESAEESRVGLLSDVDADFVTPLPSRSSGRPLEAEVDIHGRTLFTGVSFWLLFVNMTLLSGTGLMCE